LILANSGHVYSYGKLSKGRLGHGDKFNEKFIKNPQLIIALSNFYCVDIATGKDYSITLSKQNELSSSTNMIHTFGNCNNGRLGIGNVNSHVYSPKILNSVLGINFNKIFAGYDHASLLSVDGHL